MPKFLTWRAPLPTKRKKGPLGEQMSSGQAPLCSAQPWCGVGGMWLTGALFSPSSENDPALEDDELARRLRHNREVAVNRLDQVLVRYVDLQDKGVEGERHLGQAKRGGTASPEQDQPVALNEPAAAAASAVEVGGRASWKPPGGGAGG